MNIRYPIYEGVYRILTNRKGEVWHEITGSVKDTVTIDEEGKGRFLVKGGKLAVWVKA